MDRHENETFVASREDWTADEWKRAERYTFTVRWSEEDALFIAAAVEIPYAMSHGRSPEEAVHNAVDAVASVIDAATEHPDIVIPEPSGVAA
jgi:predicted RNase H-like HicB family nuclease